MGQENIDGVQPYMNSNRFHEGLYQLIVSRSPAVVVETGFASGLSAMHILSAMDVVGRGTLYSVECFVNQPIFHPRLRFVKGMSHEVLHKLAGESGPWDFFLHDSDHEVGCTTYEYEMAWAFVRSGGVIMTDDYEWGTHRSWQQFMSRYNIPNHTIVGSAAYFEKPPDCRCGAAKDDGSSGIFGNLEWFSEVQKHAVEIANEASIKIIGQPYLK